MIDERFLQSFLDLIQCRISQFYALKWKCENIWELKWNVRTEFISCVQSIQIQVQSAGIDSAMPYSGSSSSDHFDKWLTTREISIFNSFQRWHSWLLHYIYSVWVGALNLRGLKFFPHLEVVFFVLCFHGIFS